MTHPTTVEPSLTSVRALSASALPWLCSTTAHMLLVLALAITYGWTYRDEPQGADLAGGLEAVFHTSQSPGDLLGGDATDASDGAYYEDEPAPSVQQATASTSGGNDAQALSALLNEKPAVDLAGVLPAAGAGPGLGVAPGGVGSAQGLSTQPRGSGRSGGAGRGYARTGVFGAIGEGHKFVYVFDRSGSMDGHGGAPLAAAKAELIASLSDLGQIHQFQIIFYNEQPRAFNPTGVVGRLVFGTEQNKYLASKFVGSITADGATKHEEALVMALRMVPDVIFFLTDADEPRMSAKQLAHVAQTNKGTSINAIEFGYGPQSDSENFLVKLARQNGGTHVYVDVATLPRARR